MGSPRNTRKDAKGDERCGLGADVTSRDPTCGRDALLRDPAWSALWINLTRLSLIPRFEESPSSSSSSSSSILAAQEQIGGGQEWPPETREKTRKGMRGVGWEPISHRATRH